MATEGLAPYACVSDRVDAAWPQSVGHVLVIDVLVTSVEVAVALVDVSVALVD